MIKLFVFQNSVTNIKQHFGAKPIVWVPAWGISKLRKRGGQFTGVINGAATWFDDWYAHALSEDTVVKLADLGVNLVILPFSLGGDAQAEKAERDDFERTTGFLHKHGIVSLPYLQYQNILQEAFTFDNTIWKIALDGTRKQYSYWRRTPCQASPQFLDYFKGLVSAAVARGADGIWIDNTHCVPCRCDLCIEKFKQWLDANRSNLLDELYFEDFSQIEMPPFAGGIDPIAQALLDFNCQLNLDVLEQIKSHLVAIKPDALFSSNPGIERGSSNYNRGVDLRPFLGMHDLMYLENKFFPGVYEGQTSGNFHGFISCEAAGTRGIPGAWKRHDFDATAATQITGMPETEEEIRQVIFEATACGGVLGMFWAIRSRPEHMCEKPEDFLTMYFEHPAIYSGMKKTLDFVRTLPVFGDSQNSANIAVLHHRASLAFDPESSWPARHVMEELLHTSGLPYNVLFSEDFSEKASAYKVIVLPSISAMSDEDAGAIRHYVENGGKLLTLGDCGLYTDKMQERPEFILHDILDISRFKRGNNFVFSQYGVGRCASLPLAGKLDKIINNTMQAGPNMFFPAWYDHHVDMIKALDELLGSDRQIRIVAPEDVCATIRRTESGATAAHFLAYAPVSCKTSIKVRINAELARSEKAVWHTPEGGMQTVKPVVSTAGYHEYELPGFDDYGVLIIDP